MAYEDFTTYTEVDPNNHITVSVNHIDHHTVRNEDAYIYKDYGSGYFGDSFEHHLDARIEASTTGGWDAIWSLANEVGSELQIRVGSDPDHFLVSFYRDLYQGHQIALAEWYNSNWYVQTYNISSSTWYYLKIIKNGTLLQLKVYSDSARTNLLTTISLTLHIV